MCCWGCGTEIIPALLQDCIHWSLEQSLLKFLNVFTLWISNFHPLSKFQLKETELIITWAKCKFVWNWNHHTWDPRWVPRPKEQCRNVQSGLPGFWKGLHYFPGQNSWASRLYPARNLYVLGLAEMEVWWLVDWADCQIFCANSILIFNSFI